MSDKTGGPAFACSDSNESGSFHQPGMNVRQYYKGQIVQGLVSFIQKELNDLMLTENWEEKAKEYGKRISLTSGFWADAMIAEDEEFSKKG